MQTVQLETLACFREATMWPCLGMWRQCPEGEVNVGNQWENVEVKQFQLGWTRDFSRVVVVVWLFATPWICSTPSFPVPHYLPEFAQVHVHWISDAIQPFHPLSASSSSAFSLPWHQGLSSESALHIRWLKYLIFSCSISLPMSIQGWCPLGLTGWISLRSKWLSRVFSNHSSKASFFWLSAFFIVQLSHPHMTVGKTIALTRRKLLAK